MNKFISVLFIYSKNILHLLAIETAGIPAFSRAEITIALGILGVIATSTIPNFIIENQNNSLIIALQRDYSVVSNGVNLAISENGSPDMWELIDSGNAIGLSNINTILSKYLKMAKNCGTGPGCFPDINYKNLKGVTNETNLNRDPLYTKFKLLDGTSAAVTQWSADCSLDWGNTPQLQNVCGLFVVDVNGEKSPNTYGIDFFGFAFTKFGLVPLGSEMQTNAYPFSGFCNKNSNANFKYENGLSCTAWAMYNKNMDYLNCHGLSWDGLTTCTK